MRDIHDLRDALHAETTDLTVQIPPETIRRRAHRIRIRQRVGLAAAFVVVAAGAAATIPLLTESGPAYEAAGPRPLAAPCPTAPVAATNEILDSLVETDVVLEAPNAQYDVLIGLTGTPDEPSFVVAFRDHATSTVRVWDTVVAQRDPSGDLTGKEAGDGKFQFLSSQLALKPNLVLDVGFYTRTAHRITVASGGSATDAETTRDAATGWTLFWAQRRATPLPPERHTVPEFYQGPEQVTLTAYDADGRPQHTVTGGPGVGGSVHNPRDASPVGPTSPPATPDPTCPSPSAPR